MRDEGKLVKLSFASESAATVAVIRKATLEFSVS